VVEHVERLAPQLEVQALEMRKSRKMPRSSRLKPGPMIVPRFACRESERRARRGERCCIEPLWRDFSPNAIARIGGLVRTPSLTIMCHVMPSPPTSPWLRR